MFEKVCDKANADGSRTEPLVDYRFTIDPPVPRFGDCGDNAMKAPLCLIATYYILDSIRLEWRVSPSLGCSSSIFQIVDSTLKIINNEASLMALQVDSTGNKNREMAKIIHTLRTPPRPANKPIIVPVNKRKLNFGKQFKFC